MRWLGPLGIWAAAGFLMAGCGRSGTSGVDSWETKPPNEWRMSVERPHSNPIRTRRIGFTPAGPVLPRGNGLRGSAPGSPRRASDEIAGRMADDLAEWEAVRADLASAHREASSQAKSAATNKAAGKSEAALFDPSDLVAARRRRSVERLNSQLRVAVLEQRLVYADESDKQVISARLVQAKDDLKALDGACEKEAVLIKAARFQSSNGNGGSGNPVGHAVEAQPAGASNAR